MARGELPTEDAVTRLAALPFEDLGFARVDHHRALRGGPEVVYGPGKTPAEAASIVAALLAQDASPVLVTKATAGHAEAVRQVEATERLRGKLDLVGRETAQLRQRVSSLVGTVGLTRYDAFPDAVGHLSYSAAFLDEAGDGVVLSTINGRSETRSYAKPVRGGRSDHSLSDEERTAIALAMGAGNPNLASGVR